MIKVALVAIAKDEAPYLHQWIYHHINMGFDYLSIGVNDTVDNSNDILNKISSSFGIVNFENIDWVRQGGKVPFQSLSYSYLTNKLPNDITHIMYLDIDEFWFSVNGDVIHDFISNREPFDVASFQCINQSGEKNPFELPFIDVFGEMDLHVKSLVNNSIVKQVAVFGAHSPAFERDVKKNILHIDQFGNQDPLEHLNTIKSEFEIKSFPDCQYGVLHRKIRSKDEYSSVCLRGRVVRDLIHAESRRGFSIHGMEFNFMMPDYYYSGLFEFIEFCNIKSELIEAKSNVIFLYEKKIKGFSSVELIKEADNAIKSLVGTDAFTLFVNCFIDKVENVNALRDFAVKLEKVDLNFSLRLMSKAHGFRIDGPFIARKVKEYKVMLGVF